LYAAQIGSTRQQMTGKGMSQHMRRNPCRVDAGRKGRFLQKLGEALAR
jgi:hypothetical protein